MVNRRNFIKSTGLAGGLILAGGTSSFASSLSGLAFESKRPPRRDRKFISDAVESTIKDIKASIKDPEMGWLFENCFPNTLDTTVTFSEKDGKPDTFVITGDIHAMWLRDSSAQVWPYLPLASKDAKLKKLLAGVINRQTKCILIDPYANAFNDGPADSPWKGDLTDMKPELHERKWEVDSLCYPIRLAHQYWKVTGDDSVFDTDWENAMGLILQTFRTQQRKKDRGPYKFQRVTGWQTDTVAGGGYGNPIQPVGMICSIFRPSDDATIYPFLIPSNLFSVTSLRQLAEILLKIKGNTLMAKAANDLADEVEKAINAYAISEHLTFGKMYAFEVDGYGNSLFMDDANVPSLLSIPYLTGMDSANEVYRNTRKFLLSSSNPYYYKGNAAEGQGGPHSGVDMIWPLGITMRALTSKDPEEIGFCLKTLKTTHAGTGFMHESFNKDDASNFNRKLFAWANTLFGELILKVHSEQPNLLM
ncbi:MAG: glycoside hydrolase family 125 protein [Bacteroidia bacterium]|nr:glycoside hydrolase family 125 protein [Bacteroidia bacterium]